MPVHGALHTSQRCREARAAALRHRRHATRLAVLFASGTFAIFEVDREGELRRGAVGPAAGLARLGAVTDVEPLPAPIGERGGARGGVRLRLEGRLLCWAALHASKYYPHRAHF